MSEESWGARKEVGDHAVVKKHHFFHAYVEVLFSFFLMNDLGAGVGGGSSSQ